MKEYACPICKDTFEEPGRCDYCDIELVHINHLLNQQLDQINEQIGTINSFIEDLNSDIQYQNHQIQVGACQ